RDLRRSGSRRGRTPRPRSARRRARPDRPWSRRRACRSPATFRARPWRAPTRSRPPPPAERRPSRLYPSTFTPFERSVPQGNTRLNDEYPTRDRKCEGARLRVVLLGEAADRVDVDEDPDARRKRLEELQRARAGDELGELGGRDRGAV